MMNLLRVALAAGILALSSGAGRAELQVEDPLDTKMRAVATLLRCPVCQSESVYDSRATLAVEMKQIIREQLAQGRTQDEIISFFRARYGDYVLMEPPRSGLHLLIWFLPFVMFVLGIVLLVRHLRRTIEAAPEPVADAPVTSELLIADLERLRP